MSHVKCQGVVMTFAPPGIVLVVWYTRCPKKLCPVCMAAVEEL